MVYHHHHHHHNGYCTKDGPKRNVWPFKCSLLKTEMKKMGTKPLEYPDEEASDSHLTCLCYTNIWGEECCTLPHVCSSSVVVLVTLPMALSQLEGESAWAVEKPVLVGFLWNLDEACGVKFLYCKPWVANSLLNQSPSAAFTICET